MSREIRFRTLLPIAETVLAALFGGVGLWQRKQILSQPFLGDQILWESTARYHGWPSRSLARKFLSCAAHAE